MATFVEKFYNILKDDSAVGAIIANRIHPQFVDEDDPPYLTFFTVTNITANELGGTADMQGPIRMQVDCYSHGLLQLKALETAAKAALTFQDEECTIRIEGSTDAGDFAADGEDKIVRRVTIDCIAYCIAALL